MKQSNFLFVCMCVIVLRMCWNWTLLAPWFPALEELICLCWSIKPGERRVTYTKSKLVINILWGHNAVSPLMCVCVQNGLQRWILQIIDFSDENEQMWKKTVDVLYKLMQTTNSPLSLLVMSTITSTRPVFSLLQVSAVPYLLA